MSSSSSSSWSSSTFSLPLLSSQSNARNHRPLRRPSSSASSEARPIPGIDRISTIPDELLQQILSRVSLKEAVKTSLLSQRWVDLWKHRLDFCVDMGFFMRAYPPYRVHEASMRFSESMAHVCSVFFKSLMLTCPYRF